MNKNIIKHKKLYIVLSTIVAVLLFISVATCCYLGNYYHATPEALSVLNNEYDSITIKQEKGRITFEPKNPIAGLIFYPGAKIQYEAYAPLMKELSDRGVLCVLLHMPGNMAIFDIDAAEGIKDEYPNLDKWYLAGHSLGGAMAAYHIAGNPDVYDGLIFLASYSTEDISNLDIKVLSIYGSEDEILNKDSYNENLSNLPQTCEEFIIKDGCHAYFGDYGLQNKDGVPKISREEQVRITADEIEKLMRKT